jgi:phosphoribosylformimino-5-aminoimidazole carboxamide ribotide isomerase
LCLDLLGIDRAVLGSAAVSSPEFFKAAAAKYGDRIVCGIDEKDGMVAVKGWTENSNITPIELCNRIKSAGITDVVYTDISRDGALSGVNVDKTIELQRLSGLNVIASGGVASMQDIDILAEKGVYGVISGKAIYEGRLDLCMAIAKVRLNTQKRNV